MVPARPSSSRTPTTLTVFLLALGLIGLCTWAVVGKYHLDRDARQTYKSSRQVVTDDDAPALLIRLAFRADITSLEVRPDPLPPQPLLTAMPARRGGFVSSRSPPLG